MCFFIIFVGYRNRKEIIKIIIMIRKSLIKLFFLASEEREKSEENFLDVFCREVKKFSQ
jgi:hypothetical protein